jgi:hypothetical protein
MEIREALPSRPNLVMAEDLSVDNDIFVAQVALSCRLSAVALKFRFAPVDEAHIEGLAQIDTMVIPALPEFEPWLLLGDDDWWPNRPLHRYASLWYRQRKNILIPEGERLAEQAIETPEGIKFFAAVRCQTIDPSSINRLLKGHSSRMFVYLRRDVARPFVEAHIKNGWKPVRSPALFSATFLASICDGDMLVYCPVGAYDDADAGAALVGCPEPIRKCYLALS